MIKIVLPYGASNVRLSLGGQPYDMSSVEMKSSEGYLDFNGRPTYIIDSYNGPLRGDIQVNYDYNLTNVYWKPLVLTLIVLGLLLLAIVTKRVSLRAFEEKSSVGKSE